MNDNPLIDILEANRLMRLPQEVTFTPSTVTFLLPIGVMDLLWMKPHPQTEL
jgi:hypothetical protein